MRRQYAARQGPLGTGRGIAGVVLISIGEALIVARLPPLSGYYFPFVWVGFALVLDSAVYGYSGRSLYASKRKVFIALFPISAAVWWLFELFNQAVHNWIYLGIQPGQNLGSIIFATVDFSTVLPAVWTAALFVGELLPPGWQRRESARTVPNLLLVSMVGAGVLSIVLPVLFPRYFFPLVWGSLYFLLDPINEWLDRPSIIGSVWRGSWRRVATFALAALLCGFFWEAWNYWSMPKWEYNIPFVGFWHIFEMPLLGYGGYLPFGLELFAMTNFALPLLSLGTLTVDGTLGVEDDGDNACVEERVS